MAIGGIVDGQEDAEAPSGGAGRVTVAGLTRGLTLADLEARLSERRRLWLARVLGGPARARPD